jgi:hypothetical protein
MEIDWRVSGLEQIRYNTNRDKISARWHQRMFLSDVVEMACEVTGKLQFELFARCVAKRFQIHSEHRTHVGLDIQYRSQR